MSSFPFLSVPWNYYFTKFISNWNIFSIGLFVYYFLPTLDFELHRQEFCLEQSLVCNSISPVLVTQSSPTLCNPMDYSSPGSFVHRIVQATILEWVAISFSRGILLTQEFNPHLLHSVWSPSDILFWSFLKYFSGNPYELHFTNEKTGTGRELVTCQ